MRVVRPHGYPSLFNTPRHSRHTIIAQKWLPLHKVWKPLEVALVPLGGARPDMIASFNRIPLGRTPFTITFESHLPRLFAYEKSAAFRFFTQRLAGNSCRRIIPISRFAQAMFLRQHAGSPEAEILARKAATVVYPAVDVPETIDTAPATPDGLRVLFVGHHFSRKGGTALLHAAAEAHRRSLPISFEIVSNLTVGGENGVWTDPPNASFFDADLKHLDLPNVTHHGKLDNQAVLQLLRVCDVSLLPTLCDTFGYSILESMAAGVPVIATRAYALPEIITSGVTGQLLDLETDSRGEWAYMFRMDKSSARFGTIYRDTIDNLSKQILVALTNFLDNPDTLAQMKVAAHREALQRFDSRKQSVILDDIYDAAFTTFGSGYRETSHSQV